jgi:hypothetical protein
MTNQLTWLAVWEVGDDLLQAVHDAAIALGAKCRPLQQAFTGCCDGARSVAEIPVRSGDRAKSA